MKATVAAVPAVVERINIPKPKMERLHIAIKGTEPLCINRFSNKGVEMMKASQEAGSQSKSKRVRTAKDFDALFEAARYHPAEGWDGMSASAFRKAAISACRIVGFKMTLAKLAIFIIADGYDALDGTPLVKINGTPEPYTAHVRNQTGVVDIRTRPLWREWSATVQVRYDADVFSNSDIVNLFKRIGMQVGIGEGRPDSKDSAGIGFGLFDIVGADAVREG